MDCLLEVLIPIFGEFLFGLVWELLANVVAWTFRQVRTAGDPSYTSALDSPRLVAVLLWALTGLACGFVSVGIAPRPMIHVTVLRVINLIVTPLLMAGAVVAIQGWFRKSRPTPAEFLNAYLFAVCYLLTRSFFTWTAH